MSISSVPLVSVIIPTYNAAIYLPQAIEAIIAQTYQNFELLIIDDKSVDDTVAVAKKYAARDSRIYVIENIENVGIGGNRERGVKIARGNFICWQDADDISLPYRIERQVEFLQAHPRVGVVGGWIQFFNEYSDGSIRRYGESDEYVRKRMFRYNPVAQPAAMFRSECYAMVGGYNSCYAVSEDLEMLFRIGEKYQFGNVQEVVMKYRQSAASLTTTRLQEMELTTLAIRKNYKKNPAYTYTLFDAAYNLAQRASIYMPVKLRMTLFKLIRGDS